MIVKGKNQQKDQISKQKRWRLQSSKAESGDMNMNSKMNKKEREENNELCWQEWHIAQHKEQNSLEDEQDDGNKTNSKIEDDEEDKDYQ